MLGVNRKSTGCELDHRRNARRGESGAKPANRLSPRGCTRRKKSRRQRLASWQQAAGPSSLRGISGPHGDTAGEGLRRRGRSSRHQQRREGRMAAPGSDSDTAGGCPTRRGTTARTSSLGRPFSAARGTGYAKCQSPAIVGSSITPTSSWAIRSRKRSIAATASTLRAESRCRSSLPAPAEKKRTEVSDDPQPNAFSSSGSSANKSPTNPISAISKIGASASLLIATMVPASLMPVRCWMAPEMPMAT